MCRVDLPLVTPLAAAAMAAAETRQAQLTKPLGSMGRLEVLGTQLAGIARECPPPVPGPVAVAVFAGDHGVHAQAVTPWPQEVTVQMVANVAAGGAVVNALAAQVGADVVVVDVGVVGDAPAHERLTRAKVARGTADLSTGPAMSPEQARRAFDLGVAQAYRLVDGGYRMLVTGDLGLANTTPAAALVAAMTGLDPADVTGRGAGSDDAMLAHKVDVVRRAVARLDVDADPMTVLAEVGGFEHAALAGFVLGGAARRVPVLLDGLIACSAALVAAALEPRAVAYLVAGHRSTEPGASAALTSLGLEPLLNLDLRLGEGSGAVLAVPLVQAAARMLAEVATFDSAQVTEIGQHQR
jgi:nicotinate-nucleotide--dimethylbenzimidazole phosphoribosyltransferase